MRFRCLLASTFVHAAGVGALVLLGSGAGASARSLSIMVVPPAPDLSVPAAASDAVEPQCEVVVLPEPAADDDLTAADDFTDLCRGEKPPSEPAEPSQRPPVPWRAIAAALVQRPAPPALSESTPAPKVEPPLPGDDNAPPTYPEEARRRGQQGTVLLQLVVDASGAVRDAGVLHSSGHPLLDDAALEAVRRWRFRPARAEGLPLEQAIVQRIEFRLGPPAS